MAMRIPTVAALALTMLAGACAKHEVNSSQQVSAVATTTASGDWPTYGGPLSGDRYSPLAQITTATVGQLRQVCAFDAPDMVNFQSGIVAVGGVLYFTAFNNTYAVDGATCQRKWTHAREEPKTFLMVNRGVAYSDGRLFRGTGDAHIVAIDAADGRQLWDVAIGDPKIGESVPLAPIAWNGLVFAGNAGGDNFGVRGRIYALDAASGHVVWRFDTVPESGPARATWLKASAANPPAAAPPGPATRSTRRTASSTCPPATRRPISRRRCVRATTSIPNSLLALDAKTGRLLSYVQPLKNDFHDWDLAAPPALITTKGGRPFVAQGAKDGHVYNIDRSAVAGGRQRASRRRMVVRSKTAVDDARENVDVPFSTERETRFCPGVQGGVEWNGPAYHPGLGLLYVNAIDWCTLVKMQPAARSRARPANRGRAPSWPTDGCSAVTIR